MDPFLAPLCSFPIPLTHRIVPPFPVPIRDSNPWQGISQLVKPGGHPKNLDIAIFPPPPKENRSADIYLDGSSRTTAGSRVQGQGSP